jgi:hypothetical protein
MLGAAAVHLGTIGRDSVPEDAMSYLKPMSAFHRSIEEDQGVQR